MMLQQILNDRYIDPELLEELPDEQKQILFCKIREEQVRCWYEREKEFKDGGENNNQKLTSKKHVQFLTGDDGSEWVWVMGEHKNDKTVEQILEDEELEKAKKLAEKEAEEQRQREEEELRQRVLEEEARIEKERLDREAALRKQEEDAEIYKTLKEARLAAEQMERERLEKEKEDERKLQTLRDNASVWRKNSEKRKKDLISRRSSEIYSSFKSIRSKFEAMAIADQPDLEQSWRKQEETAKAAEAEMREIARRAREEHKRSLRAAAGALMAIRTLSSATRIAAAAAGTGTCAELALGSHHQRSPSPLGDVSKTVVRERPPNREAIVEWFRKDEQPKGAGLDPNTRNVASWFHGIISRSKAESLLEDKAVGAFLVRVSERIWGYAISYRSISRCKHFLIDASSGSYQFLGTSYAPRPSLSAFVNYYQEHPISSIGQEFLRYPCGQESKEPDWLELFQYNECSCNTAL